MTTRSETTERSTTKIVVTDDVSVKPVVPSRATAKLLPHEIVFGFFLLVTWLRLAVGLGPVHVLSLVFFASWLGAFGIWLWAEANPTPQRWRMRLLYYPVVMGLTFYALGGALPALGLTKVDVPLLNLDRALLGETPAVSYQAWSQPLLNDTLMLGYLFFFIHLVAIPGIYCVRNLAQFRQCIVGLFTVYGIGFLSYTLFPAGGPHRWMEFQVPLNGPVIIPATLAMVNSGSNGVDVFPSLHFAVSFYLLIFDWWHARSRFWICLIPCIILWCSTVLLRFHYFVDLVGGLVVALIGLWIAARHARSTSALS